MARRVMAGLLVVGLGIGIWWLWPWGNEVSPSPTSVLAAETTTTSSILEATTTTVQEVTTTSTGSHVVETVEEAEAILRELWFGWFEGIYLQDEDRIREVVATEEQFEEGVALFGQMGFTAAPTQNGIVISSVEILRSDLDCLAVFVDADASAFRGPGAEGSAVYILRSFEGTWGFASSWRHREDLWEADCDAQL